MRMVQANSATSSEPSHTQVEVETPTGALAGAGVTGDRSSAGGPIAAVSSSCADTAGRTFKVSEPPTPSLDVAERRRLPARVVRSIAPGHSRPNQFELWDSPGWG